MQHINNNCRKVMALVMIWAQKYLILVLQVEGGLLVL